MINPIKKFREEFNLTQTAVASLAGVTEQVVLKAEQGLYPTMQPSIQRAMEILSGVPSAMIADQYHSWIEEEVSTVRLPVGRDNAVTDPIRFMFWMKSVCELNEVENTINGFCKLFKIHPYVIQKYTSGRMKRPPVQLIERIAHIRGLI